MKAWLYIREESSTGREGWLIIDADGVVGYVYNREHAELIARAVNMAQENKIPLDKS